MTARARINVSYDTVADVLYIRSGDARYTKNIEEEAGLIVRYNPGTREAVGITISDYREYWLSKRKRLASRLAKTFDMKLVDADRALPK